jgi:hypothetical protein
LHEAGELGDKNRLIDVDGEKETWVWRSVACSVISSCRLYTLPLGVSIGSEIGEAHGETSTKDRKIGEK